MGSSVLSSINSKPDTQYRLSLLARIAVAVFGSPSQYGWGMILLCIYTIPKRDSAIMSILLFGLLVVGLYLVARQIIYSSRLKRVLINGGIKTASIIKVTKIPLSYLRLYIVTAEYEVDGNKYCLVEYLGSGGEGLGSGDPIQVMVNQDFPKISVIAEHFSSFECLEINRTSILNPTGFCLLSLVLPLVCSFTIIYKSIV
jgi:hypothetical protein